VPSKVNGFWVDGIASPKFVEPVLLTTVFFRWDVGGSGDQPQSFVCVCRQRASGDVIWRVTTGEWIPASNPLAPTFVAFVAAGSHAGQYAGAGSEPLTVQGCLPDQAWIASDEEVVCGQTNGISDDVISEGCFSFLLPWPP